MARLLFLDEAMPWGTDWYVTPLTTLVADIARDAAYADVQPAFASDPGHAAGLWGVQAYVAPGTPPPPAEVLPYAYLLAAPAVWTNNGNTDTTVATIAVTAYNGGALGLLFWEALSSPVSVPVGDTFRLSALTFNLQELTDT
jgi:hypothetical protein